MRLGVALSTCLLAGLLCGAGTWQLALAEIPEAAGTKKASAADRSTPSSPATDQTEDNERRPPLPRYFGQLGVSDKQRLDLQTIQEEYETKLQKLRTELKQLVNERDQKLEGLLTDGQKTRLTELRAAAIAKRQAASRPAQPKSQARSKK